MKFLVKFLFFILIIFFLNIIFYYISTDYKNFLQNLKYENFSNNTQNKSDNSNLDKNLNENILLEDDIDSNIANIETNKNKIVGETKLGKNYLNILNKFEKYYDLNKIEINTKLFEITDEYPDYYYEYYSNDLTLYLFTTKKYSEIYDIFNYLQKELPFRVNELNNFGEKSFYINLNDEINDKYIRLVVTQDGITYGIKFKKTQYENVKNILINNN